MLSESSIAPIWILSFSIWFGKRCYQKFYYASRDWCLPRIPQRWKNEINSRILERCRIFYSFGWKMAYRTGMVDQTLHNFRLTSGSVKISDFRFEWQEFWFLKISARPKNRHETNIMHWIGVSTHFMDSLLVKPISGRNAVWVMENVGFEWMIFKRTI